MLKQSLNFFTKARLSKNCKNKNKKLKRFLGHRPRGVPCCFAKTTMIIFTKAMCAKKCEKFYVKLKIEVEMWCIDKLPIGCFLVKTYVFYSIFLCATQIASILLVKRLCKKCRLLLRKLYVVDKTRFWTKSRTLFFGLGQFFASVIIFDLRAIIRTWILFKIVFSQPQYSFLNSSIYFLHNRFTNSTETFSFHHVTHKNIL